MATPQHNLPHSVASSSRRSRRSLNDSQRTKIEDHLPGYPRFAALLSLHPSFQVFRNFPNLRARLLLSKQDELVRSEERLSRLDSDSTFAFFRGSLREDRNGERTQLMAQIERSLAEYDLTLDRVEKSLQRHAVRERDAENVQNWIQTTGQIPRSEAAYLWQEDLVAVGPIDKDSTNPTLQDLVEDSLIWISKWAKRTLHHQGVSRDSRIHIFSATVLGNVSRFMITLLLLFMLYIPVVISVFIVNTTARICVAMIACLIFVLALSVVANAKTSELFVAGATYSAMLVAFLTGSK
ncbi:uncharacterized protein F4822DRAFT_427484 [Hypoxylon trugodes]|uniref:uncharacterized protein n=1 Tax=Hypoxylon trugodes TaxID=326681 RepID=UPI00218F9543|nr:uncharacterized protein F4822DRAFT_427484 [Hypoxylon trugodes]KAI1391628.1 hypothetical protein F4822DRAFT_427484 [Hypoxylon trugodes]